MAKISIIVPAYNVEQYLAQCLDSIIAQSFNNFELWLIDDGSTDQTARIGKEYAAKDSRIFYYFKKNEGVSSARNKGLECCTGEFVCFVDADDLLEPTYLEDLYSAIKEDHDSSVCGFIYFDCPEILIRTEIPQNKTANLEECILDFYDIKKKERQRYLWNRMLRRSIIEQYNIRFDEDIYFKEDGLFLIRFLCSSGKNVAGVNKILYRYRQNPNSAMGSLNKRFNKKLLTNIIAHKRILSVLKKYQLSSIVVKNAINTAEISCCWVLSTMNHTHFHSFRTRLWIEYQMLGTLCFNEYFRWRLERLFSKIKTNN